MASLKLPPDAKIADIGAGTGYFSVRLAKAVPQGVVYAQDIEPDMIRFLSERASDEGLSNLRPLQAKPDDPALPEPVDLVVTDVVMPRMSGPELAERLAADRPDMLVVFISGYPEDELRDRPGAELLGKPFTPSALLAMVRRLLDQCGC